MSPLFSRRSRGEAAVPVIDTNPGSTVTLRPRSAIWLPVIVWITVAILALDALVRGSLGTLVAFGPGLLVVAALMWVVFWAPRMIVRPDSVEIRNVFHTYEAPFEAIEHVGIGAMVRIEARTASGTTRSVTAWNAPGVGRDRPEPGRAVRGGERKHRPGAEERLVRDQRASDSAILVQRWERALDASEAAGAGSTPGRAGAGPVLTSTLNWSSIGIMLGSVALLVLGIAI